MEEPSIKTVPRHQGSGGQRAAAGTVSSQQVAQSSDIERTQLHSTTGEEWQLQEEEGKSSVLNLVGRTSLSRELGLTAKTAATPYHMCQQIPSAQIFTN